METIVRIKWDKPEEKHWLCAENISLALHAYCTNTKFEVTEVELPNEEEIKEMANEEQYDDDCKDAQGCILHGVNWLLNKILGK